MWWTVGAAAAAILPPTGWLMWHRARRAEVYRRLASERGAIVSRHPAGFDFETPASGLRETFSRERIIRIGRALSPETLGRALAECESRRDLVERSYIPTHKKGGTVCYESIHKSLPVCLSIYHSPVLREYLSELIGLPVFPTADHDQSSCSALFYTEAGDHIHWHYDHNFYRGRHFTVLIPLINRNAAGDDVSQSLLKRQRRGLEDEAFSTAANSMIVFEGSRVRHCATPLGKGGELRIMLSMTFATDSQIRLTNEIARRLKETAFFGLRALWD